MKNFKNSYIIILAFLIGLNACKKDEDTTPKDTMVKPDASEVATIEDLTFYKDITLGAQDNPDMWGCINLKNGYIYDVMAADDVQSDIDLVLLNGSNSLKNLVTPASSRYNAWGSSNKVRHIYNLWWKRNEGILIKLPDPSEAEKAIFDSATSVSNLLSHYEDIIDTVTRRPGYSSLNDGPANGIRKVGQGDIILFKSEERREIAVMKVLQEVPSNEGLIQLQIKTGTY